MRFLVLLVSCFLLCGAQISSAADAPDGFKFYTVKKGDYLGKIAPPEHWDIIKRVNRIDESHLIIGKKILIPTDFEKASKFRPVPKYFKEAEVFEKAMFVFLDIQYFGAYEKGRLIFWGPISSGKNGHNTPRGNFKVLWKTRHYYSRKYDAEMPFAVNISDGGYFLHAQALPGRPASHGCVRLLKPDAEKIFKWIKINDPVILTQKSIAGPAMLFPFFFILIHKLFLPPSYAKKA